jgi:hypothetical protein
VHMYLIWANSVLHSDSCVAARCVFFYHPGVSLRFTSTLRSFEHQSSKCRVWNETFLLVSHLVGADENGNTISSFIKAGISRLSFRPLLFHEYFSMR